MAAHEFDLTGKVHSLHPVVTILVSNLGYSAPGGHLTSPDTQTNWIGILGEMYLSIQEGGFLKQAGGFFHGAERNHKLGLLYELEISECGCRILVCGADLETLAAEGSLEAAVLLQILTAYLAGDLTEDRTFLTADKFMQLFAKE